MVAATCVAVGGVALLQSWARPSPSSLALSEDGPSDSSELLSFDVSNDYPAVSSLYPWRVVEPHRVTTLSVVGGVQDDSAQYFWDVYLGDQNLIPDPSANSSLSAAITFTFTKPGKEYLVVVTERSIDPSQQERIRTFNSTVSCKYVRREIRQLTDDDREDYFEAMEIVAKMDTETGKSLYGEEFWNFQYMTKKHLYGDVCTPYHSGLSFFTSHAAFTLQLDHALQSINPRVCQPYWDYTIDALRYGHHWEDSIIWDPTWFGSLSTSNEQHQLEGRFRNVTYPPRDFNFSEHNAYGIVTKRTNLDPSMLITRSHQFCDLPIDLELPGCSILMECLETTDLTSLHHCAEDQLHGNIHNVIGGFFDCPVSLGRMGKAYSEYRDLLMNMGEVASNMWSADEHISWPDYCSTDTPFEQCRARCLNVTEESLMELSEDELYDLMSKHKLAYFGNSSDRSTFDSPLYNTFFQLDWLEEESQWKWTFKPRKGMVLNSTENSKLMRFAINFACNPVRFPVS